jgi:hypothetical protein
MLEKMQQTGRYPATITLGSNSPTYCIHWVLWGELFT